MSVTYPVKCVLHLLSCQFCIAGDTLQCERQGIGLYAHGSIEDIELESVPSSLNIVYTY
jgi:hypothetical protein